MSEPNQGDPTDLFDFPEVEGMEAFGLAPPPGWGEAEDPAHADEPGSTGSSGAPAGDAAAPRPNPSPPDGATDIDEDLFGFDELYSADDDPYQNGTLTADGQPVNPVPAPEPAARAASAGEPAAAAAPGREATPQPAEAQSAEAQPAEAQSAAAQSPPAQPAPGQPRSAPAPSAEPAPTHPVGSLMSQPTERAPLDRGPRILLPEDVPYSGGASARDSRLIWALVACFLIVNTGIFWLAHLASTNVNQSITQATGVIAEALSGRGGAPVHGAEPPAMPDVVYAPVEAADDESPARDPEPWVDPRNFEGTHQFAVGRAKALLSIGDFEGARRLLFHVLANQDRVPLPPELREEIEYLIPLTYYEQGRATGESSDSDAEGDR